jgi:GNAT superfamily N-acetyltransferase
VVEIGHFELTDRARWAELWHGYLAFYETELPEAQYELTWQRLHDGRMHGRAARDGTGRIVGLTHYLFHEHGWTPGPACYLQDLFVAPEARGTGAGRALIEAVATEARQHGASRMYWLTQEGNHVARQLYDRVARNSGFIVYQYPLG